MVGLPQSDPILCECVKLGGCLWIFESRWKVCMTVERAHAETYLGRCLSLLCSGSSHMGPKRQTAQLCRWGVWDQCHHGQDVCEDLHPGSQMQVFLLYLHIEQRSFVSCFFLIGVWIPFLHALIMYFLAFCCYHKILKGGYFILKKNLFYSQLLKLELQTVL